MKLLKTNTTGRVSGAALATVAAGLFLVGASESQGAEKAGAKVQCNGANACKGKSACSTARNSCKGQNECKGQGWASLTEKDCTAKGGKPGKG